jgi:Transposase
MAHATAAQPITVGVDTHLDSHVAQANDQLGRRVGTRSVPTTPTGYQDLLAWARGLGQPIAWGVEGTGSYGAAWPASWPPTARSWWRSTDPTARPAAAASLLLPCRCPPGGGQDGQPPVCLGGGGDTARRRCQISGRLHRRAGPRRCLCGQVSTHVPHPLTVPVGSAAIARKSSCLGDAVG